METLTYALNHAPDEFLTADEKKFIKELNSIDIDHVCFFFNTVEAIEAADDIWYKLVQYTHANETQTACFVLLTSLCSHPYFCHKAIQEGVILDCVRCACGEHDYLNSNSYDELFKLFPKYYHTLSFGENLQLHCLRVLEQVQLKCHRDRVFDLLLVEDFWNMVALKLDPIISECVEVGKTVLSNTHDDFNTYLLSFWLIKLVIKCCYNWIPFTMDPHVPNPVAFVVTPLIADRTFFSTSMMVNMREFYSALPQFVGSFKDPWEERLRFHNKDAGPDEDDDSSAFDSYFVSEFKISTYLVLFEYLGLLYHSVLPSVDEELANALYFNTWVLSPLRYPSPLLIDYSAIVPRLDMLLDGEEEVANEKAREFISHISSPENFYKFALINTKNASLSECNLGPLDQRGTVLLTELTKIITGAISFRRFLLFKKEKPSQTQLQQLRYLFIVVTSCRPGETIASFTSIQEFVGDVNRKNRNISYGALGFASGLVNIVNGDLRGGASNGYYRFRGVMDICARDPNLFTFVSAVKYIGNLIFLKPFGSSTIFNNDGKAVNETLELINAFVLDIVEHVQSTIKFLLDIPEDRRQAPLLVFFIRRIRVILIHLIDHIIEQDYRHVHQTQRPFSMTNTSFMFAPIIDRTGNTDLKDIEEVINELWSTPIQDVEYVLKYLLLLYSYVGVDLTLPDRARDVFAHVLEIKQPRRQTALDTLLRYFHSMKSVETYDELEVFYGEPIMRFEGLGKVPYFNSVLANDPEEVDMSTNYMPVSLMSSFLKGEDIDGEKFDKATKSKSFNDMHVNLKDLMSQMQMRIKKGDPSIMRLFNDPLVKFAEEVRFDFGSFQQMMKEQE
ncbi:hypothetical protein PCE1_001575 [Barthelona sp. PCE]